MLKVPTNHPDKWRSRLWKRKNKCQANFYQIYFTAAYFLLCCPFRPQMVQDQKTGQPKFMAKRWRPHTILCALVTLLGFFWTVRDVRRSIPSNSKSPSLYFSMLLSVVISVTKLITIKKFWWNGQNFVDILNFVIDPSNPISGECRWIYFRKSATTALCLVYTGIALSDWFAGKYLMSVSNGGHIFQWSLTWWWAAMVDAGRYNMFLPLPVLKLSNNETIMEPPSQYLAEDYVLGTMAAIGFFPRLDINIDF